MSKVWRTQIVEYFSGARYFPDPYKVPYSDHETIAKPSDREAVQHRLLREFIRDILSPVPLAQDAAELLGVPDEDAEDLDAAFAEIDAANQAYYASVRRKAEEVGEAATLRGRDVFFTGPQGCGKTAALNAFLSKSARLGKKTVLINLLEYREELKGGRDLWSGIAESIFDNFKVNNPRLEAPEDIILPRELTRYLFDKVLSIIYPLVIGFDEVGRLRNKPVEVPFYELIRVWREKDNNLYSGQTRLRIALSGQERLGEFPVVDQEDKSSHGGADLDDIHVGDITELGRRNPRARPSH